MCKVEGAQEGERVMVLTVYFVRKPCENKTNGHWYCLTHNESFTNNFAKDDHIRTGKHRLVWICHEHGPEQPG